MNFVVRMAVPISFKLSEIAEVSKSDSEILAIKKALSGNVSDETKWSTVVEMDSKNRIYKLIATKHQNRNTTRVAATNTRIST